ncbi:hypothetical protein Aduo_000842 [Ancylostoma duodenale]
MILVYRPPDSPKSSDETLFDAILKYCAVPIPTVLLGDFNIHINRTTREGFGPASNRFETLFETCNLVHNVIVPTRRNAILDLVLSTANIVSNVEI